MLMIVLGPYLLLRASLSAWRQRRVFMAAPATAEYDRLMGKLEEVLIR